MKTTWMISLFCFLTFSIFGQHPENQIDQSGTTTVLTSYVVDLDGSVTNVKIEKLECDGCSKSMEKNLREEAIRVISAIPNKGVQKEKVKYLIPIKFNLDDFDTTPND